MPYVPGNPARGIFNVRNQFLTASSQTVYLDANPYFTIVGSELFGAFVEVGGKHVLGETDGTPAGTA